jgi:molecular chaperone GrpE (heat shock protein)
MDEIDDHLRQFKPVDLGDEDSLDTTQADQLLKLFTHLTKGQWKTQQKADHAVKKVAGYLEERSDRIKELKEDRAALQDREEQYRQFCLEVMSLFSKLEDASQESESDELHSATSSLREKLKSSAEKIGLRKIPALGETPDSLYHYVVDTVEAATEEERTTIVEVIRGGYLLQGEVLRKADVIVAK